MISNSTYGDPLELLAAIASIANETVGVERALPEALGEICRFTGWPVGHAFVVGDGGTSAAGTRLWHVDDPVRFAPLRDISESMSFDVGQGLIGHVLETGQPYWIEDLDGESIFLRKEALEAAGLASAFAIPLMAGADVCAVLEFYASTRSAPDDWLLGVMQVVGIQLGRMIERARALDRIRVEQARQRLLFEESTEALLVVGRAGLITDINPSACRLLGSTRGELLGTRLSDLAASEWEEFVEHHITVALDSPHARTSCDFVAVAHDGRRVPLEITSTALVDGDSILGIHAVVRDRRNDQRAERALRESEERFRAAFEAAPIGMGLGSLDGRWLKVNDALCRMIGYSSAELLTLRFHDVTHPDDLEEDLALGERMLAREFPSYQLEKRYIRKDGTIVWVLLCVSLVRDPDGVPAYSVAQILDIDEHVKRRARGANLGVPPLPEASPLSPRERQVLGLLAAGNTSADVGVALGIAEETVQTHVRRSMAKLDARSRTQAVASAIWRGWLGDQPLAGAA